jgi:hypothetical protein
LLTRHAYRVIIISVEDIDDNENITEEITMKNLKGLKVYGVSGPGESPKAGLAGREGRITGEESSRWGDFWIVKWEDGSEDSYSKHTVKPASEQRGIGVYYDESVPAIEPEPEIDLAALEPTIVQ